MSNWIQLELLSSTAPAPLVEYEEVTLREVAQRTGYSLATIVDYAFHPGRYRWAVAWPAPLEGKRARARGGARLYVWGEVEEWFRLTHTAETRQRRGPRPRLCSEPPELSQAHEARSGPGSVSIADPDGVAQ